MTTVWHILEEHLHPPAGPYAPPLPGGAMLPHCPDFSRDFVTGWDPWNEGLFSIATHLGLVRVFRVPHAPHGSCSSLAVTIGVHPGCLCALDPSPCGCRSVAIVIITHDLVPLAQTGWLSCISGPWDVQWTSEGQLEMSVSAPRLLHIWMVIGHTTDDTWLHSLC